MDILKNEIYSDFYENDRDFKYFLDFMHSMIEEKYSFTELKNFLNNKKFQQFERGIIDIE